MEVTSSQQQVDIAENLDTLIKENLLVSLGLTKENYDDLEAIPLTERVQSTVNILNSLESDKTNIYKTEALNYMSLPFYRLAADRDRQGDPLTLEMPGTDGLVMRVTLADRLRASRVLTAVEENAGGRFLQLTVGRMESPEALPDDKGFVLGGRSPEEVSEEVFVSIGEGDDRSNRQARTN